jgi:hypothetical protein
MRCALAILLLLQLSTQQSAVQAQTSVNDHGIVAEQGPTADTRWWVRIGVGHNAARLQLGRDVELEQATPLLMLGVALQVPVTQVVALHFAGTVLGGTNGMDDAAGGLQLDATSRFESAPWFFGLGPTVLAAWLRGASQDERELRSDTSFFVGPKLEAGLRLDDDLTANIEATLGFAPASSSSAWLAVSVHLATVL